MRFRYIKLWTTILGLILIGTILRVQPCFAIAKRDELANEGAHAAAKIGQVAPKLILPGLDGEEKQVDFNNGLPTIILSLWCRENEQKLQEFQKFYDTYQEKLNFYVIDAGGGQEDIQKLFKRNNFTMPVLIDTTLHFVRKYNNTLSTMMITNGKGIVLYNNTLDINMDSLSQFTDRLIGKEEKLPKLLFEPPAIKQVEQINTMKLGTVITQKLFKNLGGEEIQIAYSEKPTMLLFWLDFSSPDTLDRYMKMMEDLYIKNREKVNFYSVAGTSKSSTISRILEQHNSTVPVLIDVRGFLNYTRSFPSFVIIDAQGVLRFRPPSGTTIDQLQVMLDECQKPYSPQSLPQNAIEWSKLGDAYLEKKYYLEAIDAYDHSLSLDPMLSGVYRSRGLAYSKQNNYKKAFDDYTKSIALDPNEISQYYSRAKVSLELRNYSQVVVDYTQIITLKPNELQAYMLRGNYYLDQGKPDMAISDYTNAMRIDRSYVEAYLKRGAAFYVSKRYVEAFESFAQAIAINSREAEGYYGRGLIYSQQQNQSKAIDEFSKAISIEPKTYYYYSRVKSYIVQNQIELAIADLTSIIKLRPKDEFAYYNRGLLYRLQKKYPEAITDFTEALKGRPRNGEFLFALAQCLELNQEQERALETYKLAYEYLPQYKKDLVKKAQNRIAGDWESEQEWIQ